MGHRADGRSAGRGRRSPPRRLDLADLERARHDPGRTGDRGHPPAGLPVGAAELRSDWDLDLLMDALIGPVLVRAALLEHALDDAFIVGLVDLLLDGARQ